jgi:hypothetical protein
VTSRQWREFFELCRVHLGAGAVIPAQSGSWCSWTTFDRLHLDAGYWQAGLPGIEEIGETGIGDGGAWEQGVPYAELAHLILPGRFYRAPSEQHPVGGYVEQDLGRLSRALFDAGIEHRLTEFVLEIKLY